MIDTNELRQLAEVALGGAEHRPSPCTICELAELAKRAADELDLRRGHDASR